MVKLVVSGHCKHCENIELELLGPEKLVTDDFEGRETHLILATPIVRCIHADVCKYLEKETK